MRELLYKRLNKICEEKNIAGMSVAVTDKEKIVYQQSFGYMDAEKKIPSIINAKYKIASITKIITGLSLLKMCSMGILSLDEPVSKWIRWLKLPNGAQDIITLRNLLSHTATLPKEYTPDGPFPESALGQKLKEELEVVELNGEIGKNFLYSNLGIRLASYIGELCYEMPFSEYSKKLVLEPLGMGNSTYYVDEIKDILSMPHDNLKPIYHIETNLVRLGAGGLFSDTQDLSKLARCILNKGKSDSGDEILTEEYFNQMITPHIAMSEDETHYYGLTTRIDSYKNRNLYGHFGNAKPYCSSLLCDYQTGYGVVLLMNSFQEDLRTEIPVMIFDLLTGEK